MLKKILYCLKFIGETIVYIIYPPICPICREIVDERGELCPNCASKVFHINTGKNLPEILSGVLRITKYRGGTREILRKLKFDNNLSVLPAIKKMLDAVADNADIKNFLAGIDAATFVPLHADRLKTRGYNQTELIFSDWLKAQNLPTGNFLVRQKSTAHLYSYNFAERQQILQDAFALADGVDVRGKNILIVDDIYTTGATTAECARILKNAGAAKIFVMAFASDFGE